MDNTGDQACAVVESLYATLDAFTSRWFPRPSRGLPLHCRASPPASRSDRCSRRSWCRLLALSSPIVARPAPPAMSAALRRATRATAASVRHEGDRSLIRRRDKRRADDDMSRSRSRTWLIPLQENLQVGRPVDRTQLGVWVRALCRTVRI
jgi:hypothetical protein